MWMQDFTQQVTVLQLM